MKKHIGKLTNIILAVLLLIAIANIKTDPREIVFKAQLKQHVVELGDDADCTNWRYKKSRYVKCVWTVPLERIDAMKTYAFNDHNGEN